MRLQRAAGLGAVSLLLVLPPNVWGQAATGAIAGNVKDTSGAVLPGVTVEAASPALIEKTRSVVTDDRGEYRIVELRPGTYTVTFTLPGFATMRRERIELTSSFTANVNAELKVGGLEETITVSGQTPVVDVSSARQQTTVGRAVLDAIPTTKRLGQYASFIPGATYANPTSQDSGGMAGEGGQPAVHGQHHGDQSTNLEGMGQNNRNNDVFSPNAMMVQEVVVETGATSAEAATGGVQVNIIPKDGGNSFSGSFSSSWATPKLQADNIGQDLLDRAPGGLQKGASLNYFRDNGGALGGPIKRDKVWFYTAHRFWAVSKYIQGGYYNKLQNQPVAVDSQGYRVLFYEADLTRRAHPDWYYHDDNLRLTFQATPKQKVVGSFSRQDNCNCPIGLSGTGGASPIKSAPEAGRVDIFVPIAVPMATWTYPATNRLLFDAAASLLAIGMHSEHMPGVGPKDLRITDVGLNVNYGAAGAPGRWTDRIYNTRFAVSYVTGSHTFKTGFTFKYFGRGQPGRYNDPDQLHGARSYTFQNRVPRSVTIYAQPYEPVEHTTTTGAYVQDQWAVNKFTVNVGLRYDAFNGATPTWTLPPGIFVPERPFVGVTDAPNYKNVSPRLSVIYDLFGNGKTALKASLGRYVPLAYSAYNNPAANQASSTTRSWNDSTFGAGDPRTANYLPDCNLINPNPNGECGGWNDRSFGSTTRPGTNWSSDALTGFNNQFYNWQVSTSVQHELRPGVALNVGYFRTWYDNFLVTDNLATTASDYDPFCVTVPTDNRLPKSGQQLCGFTNITPAAFLRAPDNLRTLASNYGKMTEIYNGVDITLTARFGRGGQFSGGASIGRTVTDACEVAAKVPEGMLGNNTLPAGSGAYNGTALLSIGGVGGSWMSKEYCRTSPPLSAGSQVKFLIVYPLPLDLQASAIYQNMPGIPIRATYQVSNANVGTATSLGRSLAGPAISVELMDLGERYEDRLNQLDLRLSRLFTLKKLKLKANIDISNVLNQSQLFAAFVGYGPNWLTPYEVMGGRLARLTAQLDF